MFTLPVRLVSTFFKKSQIQGDNFTFVAKFTITSSDLNLRSQLANLTASGFRRQEISKSYLYRSITLINVDGIKTVIATVWICQTIAVIFDLFPAFFTANVRYSQTSAIQLHRKNTATRHNATRIIFNVYR